jgi:hypothetical protein
MIGAPHGRHDQLAICVLILDFATELKISLFQNLRPKTLWEK